MSEKVIVIGGTAAGLSAASKAKRMKPTLDIMVFEKSGYISYGACGLPYFIGDVIKDPDELISVTADEMEHKRGIQVRIHHEVTEINLKQKQVIVKDLTSGECSVHSYDKLVIATGAKAMKPDIPGIDANGVFCLRTMEDGILLKRQVIEKPQTAVIIGGGYIGLEVAEELAFNGISVHIFETMPRLLPFLHKDFSVMLKKELEKHGVTVHLEQTIESILTENGHAVGIRDGSGNTISTGLIVVATGAVPASELAEKAGLQIGYKNGIVVDDSLQTSSPDVWACGDCVQMKHLLTGKPAYVPLGTTANKQGRMAGSNLVGGNEEFPGVLGSSVTKIFDLFIANTGLSLEQAVQEGFDAVTCVVKKSDKASYYPGGQDNHICLVFDKSMGRLLGAQALGSESVAGRMNVLVTAISCEMTVAEINDLDLVYAPPIAPVYDPILIAASQAMKGVELE